MYVPEGVKRRMRERQYFEDIIDETFPEVNEIRIFTYRSPEGKLKRAIRKLYTSTKLQRKFRTPRKNQIIKATRTKENSKCTDSRLNNNKNRNHSFIQQLYNDFLGLGDVEVNKTDKAWVFMECTL